MKAPGRAVARSLEGSWRATPPTPTLPPHTFEGIVPTLHATAASGLAWWRVRGSPLEGTAGAEECHNAFRIQALEARRHEDRLVRALRLFDAAGVRPILAKGWSVARLYPRPGLRPFGDIDLHVDPGGYPAIRAFLAANRREAQRVDLHQGVPHLQRAWSDVAARSVEAALGATRIRVLGPEDHLALLCRHLLSHGAWRPLWLCDVALFVEELPGGFDWDYLGALPSRCVEEVRLVAQAAHLLLGASLDRTPWPAGERMPEWFPRAILQAWGRGGHYSLTAPIASRSTGAAGFMKAARLRWPNPIEATVRWNAPYNALPRLPYQLADAVARGAKALWEAPRVRAGGVPSPPRSPGATRPG